MAFAVEEATIESIQAALPAKELSVAELVGAYLERIERIDPALNSIVTTSETALERAKELDERAARAAARGSRSCSRTTSTRTTCRPRSARSR